MPMALGDVSAPPMAKIRGGTTFNVGGVFKPLLLGGFNENRPSNI
jgi:hypothetical protein